MFPGYKFKDFNQFFLQLNGLLRLPQDTMQLGGVSFLNNRNDHFLNIWDRGIEIHEEGHAFFAVFAGIDTFPLPTYLERQRLLGELSAYGVTV